MRPLGLLSSAGDKVGCGLAQTSLAPSPCVLEWGFSLLTKGYSFLIGTQARVLHLRMVCGPAALVATGAC